MGSVYSIYSQMKFKDKEQSKLKYCKQKSAEEKKSILIMDWIHIENQRT